MVDSYPLRVRENILPLSIAGTLPEAFKEWYFTDHTIDHEAPIEDCQLCNQEQISLRDTKLPHKPHFDGGFPMYIEVPSSGVRQRAVA